MNVDYKMQYLEERVTEIRRHIKPNDTPLDEGSVERLKLFMTVLGCAAPIIQKPAKNKNVVAEWRSTTHYMQMEFDELQPKMKLDVRPPSQGVAFDLKAVLKKEGFDMPKAMQTKEEIGNKG